ncbi:DUF1707 SHOCT-like domain-containing protein [Actinomycetospora cinnamomea]|uniref:Uncharacterized protein DUF1707 n=1 Tax=Actinomycetospora cinnamomea TaxID=663609 RepID=A0A2U1EA13_9PSEU|nr:DUF1707 domain-containing protein [Actinomycetospora cinnamomea]PVY96725.1 uncharacterized protein DUF1707 [Actinomycetospora cinnamomea]
MTAQDPAPEMRIGDRERRACDDRLRAALDDGVLTVVEYDERTQQCWAARTQRELDALVVDLPPPAGPADAPTVVAADTSPAPSRPPFGERIGKAIVPLVLAGVALFIGGHLVTADDGGAVFGSRTVTVMPDDPQVEVAVLFGSTRVVVPPGVVARTTGTMIFGSTECAQACAIPAGAPTLPEVVVDATGAFGSVEVVTAAEAAQGGIDRDRDDGDDD